MNKWLEKINDWISHKETLAPLPERDVFQVCSRVRVDWVASLLGKRNICLRAECKTHSGACYCRWRRAWAILGLDRDI